MAYLTKEAYEGKREWVARRMAENREIDTLTEEQHEVIEWLCSVRHDVHCNQEDFFIGESSNCDKYWGYIEDGCGGEINKKLSDVGLDKVDWSFNPEMYDTDSICYELGYSEEEIEEARESCMEMASKFNNDIEKYLTNIDKQHGTSYCPSGATRIF